MDFSTDHELKNVLEKIAIAEQIYDFQIKPASASVKGDGFIGEVNGVQIIGTDKDGEHKKLDLVVKRAKQSEIMRERFPISEVFSLEIGVYRKILTAYQEMEEEKGLPPTRLAPKYYWGNTEERKELLVLENLKERGYKMCKKEIPLDEEHVSAVVQQYGKFHAFSLALREEHPEKFKEIKSFVFQIWDKICKDDPELFSSLYSHKYKKSLEVLDPVADEEALRLCTSFSNKTEAFTKKIYSCNDDPYSVILHGDCWTNNFMFKYDGNSNKPEVVEFLDFQILRFGSPVIDLVYFLYPCSSKKVIDNIQYYVHLYYNSLTNQLRIFGKDPDKLYPPQVFKEHWEKYARFGLLISPTLIHIMLSTPEEAVDVAKVADSGTEVASVYDFDIAMKDIYNDRIRDILLHFAKYDSLDD